MKNKLGEGESAKNEEKSDDMPPSDSNAKYPTVGYSTVEYSLVEQSSLVFMNILVGKNPSNKILIRRITNIMVKISENKKLSKEDVEGIENSDIDSINSGIIKSRSTFDFFKEDLANETRKLLNVLKKESHEDGEIEEATKVFKKKAGIKNLTPVSVINYSPARPSTLI